MKELFVGGLAVLLARVVKGQVGMMYSVVTAEDVESSLQLESRLAEAGKLVEVYKFHSEVTALTSFSSIEEAQRFLIEEPDTLEAKAVAAA